MYLLHLFSSPFQLTPEPRRAVPVGFFPLLFLLNFDQIPLYLSSHILNTSDCWQSTFVPTDWCESCKLAEIRSKCHTAMSARPPSSMALRQTVGILVCPSVDIPDSLHRLLYSPLTRGILCRPQVEIRTLIPNRRDHKPEPMVSSWRSSVHLDSVGYGTGHDTRSRFPLLGPLEKEVRSEPDVGLLCILLRHHLSVVLLGLFLSLFEHRYQRFHWRLDAFWTDGNIGVSKSGIAPDPRASV